MKSIRSPLSAIFALLSGGLAAVFVLWVISCGKDKPTTSFSEADAVATERSGGSCECQYMIDSIYFPSGEPANFLAQLNTQENSCAVGSCLLLHGSNFKIASCAAMFHNPPCQPAFSSPIPTGWRNFNCSVPAFNDFKVFAPVTEFNTSCGFSSTPAFTIKYKIKCRRGGEMTTPPGCPEYLSDNEPWSDITVVETSSGGGSNPFQKTNIGLAGCGCRPVLYE